jgi:PAS domain-containing protein
MEYVNPAPEPCEPQTGLFRKCALPAIFLLTALGIAISIVCLSVGYTIVFQNIFYIPIILACFIYARKGILYTTLISCVYFILVLAIPKDYTLIYPAIVRVVFFEFVGVFTAFISDQKNKAELKLEEHKKAISDAILTETKFLNEELNHCLDRESESNDAKVLADHIIESIPVAIVAWTTDGTIVRSNARFRALYQKQDNDICGIPIDDIDAGMRRYTPADTYRNGRPVFWSWTPLTLAKSSKNGILATGIEMTEGKQHE